MTKSIFGCIKVPKDAYHHIDRGIADLVDRLEYQNARQGRLLDSGRGHLNTRRGLGCAISNELTNHRLRVRQPNVSL